MLRVSWIHFLLICSDITFSCLKKKQPKTVALILNQFFKGWIVLVQDRPMRCYWCWTSMGTRKESLWKLCRYSHVKLYISTHSSCCYECQSCRPTIWREENIKPHVRVENCLTSSVETYIWPLLYQHFAESINWYRLNSIALMPCQAVWFGGRVRHVNLPDSTPLLMSSFSLHPPHLPRCLGDILEIGQQWPREGPCPSQGPFSQAPTRWVSCLTVLQWIVVTYFRKQSDKNTESGYNRLMLSVSITLSTFERRVNRQSSATNPVSLSARPPLRKLLLLSWPQFLNCGQHTSLGLKLLPPTPLSLLQQIFVGIVGAHSWTWKMAQGLLFYLPSMPPLQPLGIATSLSSWEKQRSLYGTGLSYMLYIDLHYL